MKSKALTLSSDMPELRALLVGHAGRLAASSGEDVREVAASFACWLAEVKTTPADHALAALGAAVAEAADRHEPLRRSKPVTCVAVLETATRLCGFITGAPEALV